MSKVIIVVNAQVQGGKISATAPVTAKMASALSKSVTSANSSNEIEILSGADLWSRSIHLSEASEDLIYCPLTIKLPDWFHFPAQKVYYACRDLEKRRRWVKHNFDYQTTHDNVWLGDLWLPLILTKEKLIYSSIIGEGMMPNDYQQPNSVPLEIYSGLKKLGSQLLDSINAVPSVYLLQFKIVDHEIVFDRLWPFPATPAVASVNAQNPDLYSCHWRCLSGQTRDLKIQTTQVK